MKKIHVLHLGNIANNAYNNSKLLRKRGIQSEVICNDYYFIMGTPEWEDASIDGYFGNSFSPDWTKVNLKGFKRPKWFIQGSLEEIAETLYDYPKNFTNRLFKFRASIYRLSTEATESKSTRLKFYALLPAALINEFLLRTIFWFTHLFKKNEEAYFQELIGKFHKFFPSRPDQLKRSDFTFLARHRAELLKPIFSDFDLVQGYETNPVYAMLANKHPYIAYEHGTLRDFPFEDSSMGRLTALAYRLADFVMVTNPDVISSIKKLGIKNYAFVPHVIDWKFKPKISPLRQKLLKKYRADFLVFAPARQNWPLKRNDLAIKGFAEFSQENPKAKMIIAMWGQDIQKTQELIEQLKLKTKIIPTRPLPKQKFVQYYNASDVVIDQFAKGFGGIIPEALACGKPVIMDLDFKKHQWAFPMPPVIQSKTSQDIAHNLSRLWQDKKFANKISQQGLAWTKRYYSWPITLKKHLEIYEKIQ